jgi:hypothetical protein
MNNVDRDMNNIDMDMDMAMMAMMATSASMNGIDNMRTIDTIRLRMAEQEQQDPYLAYAGHPQFKSYYTGYGYGYDDHDVDVEDDRTTPTMSSTSSHPHDRGHSTSNGIGLFGRGSSFVSNSSDSASPLLNSLPSPLDRALACANAKKSSIASTPATASYPGASRGKKRHLGGDYYMQIRLLQEEVGCLNDLGCSLFNEGHLQKSVVHFHHGMDRIKTLSFLERQHEFRRMPHPSQAKKKKNASASHTTSKSSQSLWLRACLLDGNMKQQEIEDGEDFEEGDAHGHDADTDADSYDSDSGPALKAPKRPGALLLPVDTSCHVWSNHGHGIHWETITSIALMHNASMVRFKAKSYGHAKKLLDLARGLLKGNLTSSSLNILLDSNQYTVYVVVSLYIAFGRVLLKMPSVAGKYKQSKCEAQAKQAHIMASTLLKRYNYKQHKMTHNMGMGMGINTCGRSMPIYNHPQYQQISRCISGQQHDAELDLDTGISANHAGVNVYDPMDAPMPHNHGATPALRHIGSSSVMPKKQQYHQEQECY